MLAAPHAGEPGPPAPLLQPTSGVNPVHMLPCPLHSTCQHLTAAAVAAAAAVLAAAVAAHLPVAPATDLAVAPAAAHQTALPAAYGAALGVGTALDEARRAAAFQAAVGLRPRYGSSPLLQGAA